MKNERGRGQSPHRRITLNTFQTIFAQFDWTGLSRLFQRMLGVLVCLTVHETCHGLAAYALGDPTAKRMRRLSFNPLHHIDWLGLASMVICGFGWAKPVPVDMRYFKNPKAGMAVTALAGPASNFLLALGMLFAASVLPVGWATEFLLSTAILSIGLGLFNLVPIPPLDGSKVLFALLPQRAYYTLMRYERYGMLVLLLLVSLDVGSGALSAAITAVFWWMAGLFF